MANILDQFVSHVPSIDGLDKEIAARSVVISKISPETRDEDILIYFQKRKNGGGEVERVRISDEGQAVITFEACEVAEGVLKRRHNLNGFELELSSYRFVTQEPPEVFLRVSARVNFEASGLSSEESRRLLKKVQKHTNIDWHEGCDGFILSGTFDQLEHSRQILGTVLGSRLSQGSGQTESSRCAPEHLVINENTETANICRVEVQPQFMKLLSRAYERKIRRMEEKFCIKIAWEENTDRAEIIPRKKMPNTKLYDEGCDAFITLYQKVFGEMKRELVTLDNQDDEKAIDEVIDAVTAHNIVVVEKLDGQLSVYGFKRAINKAVQDLNRRLAFSKNVSQRTENSQTEREAASGDLNNLNTAFLDKPELKYTLSNGVQISLRQGDITEERVDAIVNAANEKLRHDGGVAGAILSKGGRQIEDDSRKVMSVRRALEVGEVVHTRGGNLACQFVIHAVGPRWMDHGRDGCIILLLRACVESLRLATRLKLRSIALPAISSGIFGMPKDLCAGAMFDAVEEFSSSVDAKLGNLRDVRLVIIDDTTVEVFRKEFTKRYLSQGRLPTRSANQSDQFGIGNPCAESVNSCEENGDRVSETITRDPIAEAGKTKETPPANKDASSGETRRSLEATQKTESETAHLSEVGDGNGDSKKIQEPLHRMSTEPKGEHLTKTLNNSKENLSGREASDIVVKTENTKDRGTRSIKVDHGSRCASEHLAINENMDTANIFCVKVQSQFMKLLNRAYKRKIRDMEEKFCYKIVWEENSDRAEIIQRKKMPNTKLYDEGCDAFITLYQRVFGETKRELVSLGNQDDDKTIDEVIDAVTARNIVIIEKLDGRLSVYGFKRQMSKAVQDLKRRLAFSKNVSQRTENGQTEREAASGDLNTLNTASIDKPELEHTLSNGVQISLRQGDIAEERVDAIVNPANEKLLHGGEDAVAIFSKMMSNGQALQVGEVVYTRGGNLPCQYVVHTVGPRWKDHGRDGCILLLGLACVESLRLAILLNVRSIAFPAISSGSFGMPKDLCAGAMFDAVEEFSSSVDAKLGNLRDVRLVIGDDTTVEVFRKEFKKRYLSQGRLPTRSANQSDQFGVGNPCAKSGNSCEENGDKVSETDTRDPIAEAAKTKEMPPANKDVSSGETRRGSKATQRTENETAPLSEVGGEKSDSKKTEEPLLRMPTAPEGDHSLKTLNNSKENWSGKGASDIVAKSDSTKDHGKHGLLEAPPESRNWHRHDSNGSGTALQSEVRNENGDSRSMEEPLVEKCERPNEDEQSIRTLKDGKDGLSREEAGASVANTENTETESKVSVKFDRELLSGPTENQSKILPFKERLGRGRGALAVCFPTRTNEMAPHPQPAGRLDATTEAKKVGRVWGRGITSEHDSSTKRPPGLRVTTEGIQLAEQNALWEVDDSSSSAKADGNYVSNVPNTATRREDIAEPDIESEAPSGNGKPELYSDSDKTSAAEVPHSENEGSKLDVVKRHSPLSENLRTESPNEIQDVTENKLGGGKRPAKDPDSLADVSKDSKVTSKDQKVPSKETVATLQMTSNKLDSENSDQRNLTGDKNINDITFDALSQKTKLPDEAEEKSVPRSQLADFFDDDPDYKANASVSREGLLDSTRSAETKWSDPTESDSELDALSPKTNIENVRNKRSSEDEAIFCNKFPKLKDVEKSSQKVDSGLPRVHPSDVRPASNREPPDTREDEEKTPVTDSVTKEESPVASPEDATLAQKILKIAMHPIKEKADDDTYVNIPASSDILADEDPDTPPPPQYEEIKNCCDQSICCICQLPPSDPVSLPRCAHISCRSCLEGQALCPLCDNNFTGDEIFQGRQPVGGMTWRVESRSFLPGYKHCGTIVINYNFPNSTQGPEHPNPGAPFQGLLLTAYLPDNAEGRSVFRLLCRAFNAGLLFTVGPSPVNGELDRVICNGVEHKTNVEGGPANYGYPDPSYLDRVRVELREKGVFYCGSDPTSKRIDELTTRFI